MHWAEGQKLQQGNTQLKAELKAKQEKHAQKEQEGSEMKLLGAAALRARLERIAPRLRAEREERRLNETRLAAALRETRRALERAVAERETQTDGVIRF